MLLINESSNQPGIMDHDFSRPTTEGEFSRPAVDEDESLTNTQQMQ